MIEQVRELLIKDYGINDEGATYIANDTEYINLVFDEHEFDKEVKLMLVDEYGFEDVYAEKVLTDVKSVYFGEVDEIEFPISSKEIESWMEEEGYEFTDNIEESLYILPDGQMISGGFDMGMRSEDHRMIESLVDSDRYDDDFWSKVHDQTGVVRYAPETNFGLIATDQKLTNEQLNLLEDVGATIEPYCKSLKNNKQVSVGLER